MITPTVTEITRALEPIDRDTFSDVPDGVATIAGLRSRYAASGLPGAALARRPANEQAGGIVRTLPQRAADDALFMLRTRAA
ncbi:MAG: hypothetical protein QOK16_3680 [Solirubrobacteraceae bacterium]|jgi:hypothetical protein|nr:hypothetical protein [Solirubrobacteraceae bacterium]MEA2188669.1 hypothetical protein [Solirubrobacteraceae bacterium]